MLIEQIWTGNPLRNFNYLIACPDTGEALAIDPLDHRTCREMAAARGWTIRQILNTHEHHDHIGGNQPLIAATGARLLAHHDAGDRIAGIDRGLRAGDVVTIGRGVELEVLDTPGHTMSHLCLLAHTDRPALFTGDTLFNAGAGNCRRGGDPRRLYDTFALQLAKLSDEVRVFPGHDYIANNLRFTLDREPDNDDAGRLLEQVASQDPAAAMVTTMGLEKRVNCFLRLHCESVIAELRRAFPDLPDEPDPATVFIRLRELRDSW